MLYEISKAADHIRIIARNITSSVSAQFFSRLLTFITTIFLCRYLGVAGLGKYSFVIVFLGFFGFISDLGLTTLVTREVSYDRSLANKYFQNYLSFQLLLGFLILLSVILSINLFSEEVLIRRTVYVASCGILFAALARPYNAILMAAEEMHYIALTTVLSNLINAALIFLLITAKGSIFELGIIFAFFYFVQLLLLIFFTYRKGIVKFVNFTLDILLWKYFLKSAPFFTLLLAFSMIYNKIDILMLSKMKGDVAVGYYSAAYKLIDFLLIISSGIGAALFPLLSRQYIHSKMDQLSFICIKSSKYLMSLALPIVVGTSILAPNIIRFLYGIEFNNSSVVLTILIWSILMQFTYMIFFHMLISIKKINMLLIITGIGALLNIVLNLLFIPRFGYIGASLNTVFCEIILLTSCFFIASRYLTVFLNIRELLPAFISVFAMGIFVYLFKEMNLIIISLSAAVIYSCGLFLTKFLKEDDLAIISQVIRKNKPNTD